MVYRNILVTGGAGFVGSNICVRLMEQFENITVTALDNLYRKGSELNVPRLKKSGVQFITGDVRNRKELTDLKTDLIIECSAEPSVTAGLDGSPQYLLDTNLAGAINCFECARLNHADVIFLSTSRVYPQDKLNALTLHESETRFILDNIQPFTGITENGVGESFPLEGVRSLYGATKLAAELLLAEYIDTYKIRGVINRFGVIAGPWQFGKSDQGIIAYWLGAHLFGQPLSYIGYDGKQVRDILHVDDAIDLLLLQMDHMDMLSGKTFNAGGGLINSISLRELTEFCQDITGRVNTMKAVSVVRKNDVKLYITDNTRTREKTGWNPKRTIHDVLSDTFTWMENHNDVLFPLFAV